MTETIRSGGRQIEITHPGKPLFTRPKITKLNLACHYEQVAEVMLPHLHGRALALESFPQGPMPAGSS